MRLRLCVLLIIFCGLMSDIFAQPKDSMISGKVFSSNNEIIEFASVYVKNTTHGCSTNEKGVFHLKLRAGTHTIVFSALGFETQERIIEIKNGERIRLNISLKPHLMELEEVTVTAGGVSRINKSAFNAVAVDTKGVQNSTRDIAQVLDNISGVKIREEGGVGSSSQINLNGFTGKHVKIFMDGVPMEGAGSSFQINNIPANLAERIEVYKGVVPVDFGGDALGGAINIVTAKASNTYVDASYSYGSFNTHRTNVSFGYTGRRGFTFQLNAYQNYSDNDYKVKTQYTDVNTGAVSKDEQWFRRFHDKYHNEAVVAQIGVVNKSWADRMIFGVTYSREYAQIQNANLMKIVFGGKYRTTEGLTPSFSYDKKNLFVKNLDLSMTARYNEVLTNNVDTVAREYSWTGEYREKDTQGEGVATLAEFKGKTGYWVTNLNYRIGNRHFFSFNNMYSNYTRQTTNSAANASQSTAATFMRRKEEKNITGLSYKYVHSERWNLMAFTKYYYSHVCGPVNISSGTGRDIYEEQTRSIDATGYGLASAYNISKHWQAKLSYEKTYRLPTERELFGDGDYESGDAAIRPENSNNVNANLSYMITCADDHSISFDLGINYSYLQDYIIQIGIASWRRRV